MRQKNRLRSGSGKPGKLNPKNWYIVLIKKDQGGIITVKAFVKFVFPNSQTAQMFIDNTKEFKHLFLVKMSGKKVMEYGINISKTAGRLAGVKLTNIDKYKYPPDRITFQNKKSYRTTLRRHMRDYGKYLNTKFY